MPTATSAKLQIASHVFGRHMYASMLVQQTVQLRLPALPLSRAAAAEVAAAVRMMSVKSSPVTQLIS